MDDLKNYISTLRRDFSLKQLDELTTEKNPFLQFEKWLKEAVAAQIPDPNAMVLSTATAAGKPSGRVVLLRGFNPEHGFIFYTNYNSRKGREISENSWAALTFFWPQIERQVRIEGKLEKQSADDSDRYFQDRPKESKIGAWTSPQSEVIANRDVISDKFLALTEKYADDDIPRPPFWGGYYLKPDKIEFWQGRPNRLHDRILYSCAEGNTWKIERLAP